MKTVQVSVITTCLMLLALAPQSDALSVNSRGPLLNDPEREEEFMDWGLGMFVHWSHDSQIGSVISHSMVGATEKYLDRFINELPKTFNPKKYDPDEWMEIAKLAGVKYMVLTTKHHSGFCMWDTKTTDFSIMNTPYGKDIVKEYVEACRRHGIKVGFYFSPEDFYFQRKMGLVVRRVGRTEEEKPPLAVYNKQQLDELFGNYGPIDVMFFDGGEKEMLTQYIHNLQPKCLVTRGEMETPEQRLPKTPLPGPWESCFTLGNQWQFKPTNDDYKTGGQLINMLIENRAKGGNLLINVGPEPSGIIPFEQERRFRELALWMFINDEAIHSIRPCPVISEGKTWYTQSKDGKAVYAFLTEFTGENRWRYGDRKEILLKELRATPETTISVLGHAGKVREYSKTANPEPTFKQTPEGLELSVMRAQRIYNNKAWPNTVVVKLENVEFINAGKAVDSTELDVPVSPLEEAKRQEKKAPSEPVKGASGITWSSRPASAKKSGGGLVTGLFETSGKLVYAENTGGSELTFDGITFQAAKTAATTVLGVSEPSYNGYHVDGYVSDTGMYPSPKTVKPTLTGLTPGKRYRVQVLCYDMRNNQNGQHILVDGHDLGRFGNGIDGAGLLVTGTFVAKGPSQTFKLQRTEKDGTTLDDEVQLNALAVHEVL